MPELMVQHALNAAFSVKCGLPKESICLSTVPPTAPPAPCMRLDLPYAVALRELFPGLQDAGPAEHQVHGLQYP